MNNSTNPFELFKSEAPEVYEAYNGFIQSLIRTDGLDPKTKQLIYIGMKVVTGDKTAVKFHIPMARQAGASRAEIRDTILLCLTVAGLKAINDFLPDALAIYDNS